MAIRRNAAVIDGSETPAGTIVALDPGDTLAHVGSVAGTSDHPDYETALEALGSARERACE